MKKLLLLLLLTTAHFAFAQNFSIRGRVIDRDNAYLTSASVSLLYPKDSSLVVTTNTNNRGSFLITNVPKKDYIFKISFIGFTTFYKSITPTVSGDTLQLGLIELKPLTVNLSLVTVTNERPPINVKKDTLEYNGNSFQTRSNANLEQLFKKLPGVIVEKDGNITMQGESVTRIYVDGKEFFGGNLQMATKNLPADIIEKIQVIDGKSEEAKFSGIDDGKKEKIINVTIKEEKQKMGFGKAMVGVGTRNRYMAQGNYNRFSKENQFSFSGMSNNVNNQLMSADGFATGGVGNQSYFQNNGLSDMHLGGLNFFNQVTKKTRISGSYQLNYIDTHVKNNLSRQNFLPDGIAFYFENNRENNINNSNLLTTEIEHKTTSNTFRVNAFLTYAEAKTNQYSARRSVLPSDSIIFEGDRTSKSSNRDLNLNANLFYGHQFNKKGRAFTINNEVGVIRDERKGLSHSLTKFSDESVDDIGQRNEQENNKLNHDSRISYTEPLGSRQYLQVNYNISNRMAKSDIEVFDIANGNNKFNRDQSVNFSTDYLYHQGGITYRFVSTKSNISIGFNYQESALSRKLKIAGGEVKKVFRNFLPGFSFQQEIKKNTMFSLEYNTSVNEPSTDQLQPIAFRYDPVNVYAGNPNLRPEYTHQGRVNFNSYNIKSGIFLSGSVNLTYATNPIIQAVKIDEKQVLTTQHINVRERKNASAFINVGFPVKKINSQLNIGPFFSKGHSINLLNESRGNINQISAGGNAGYSFSYKDYIDINLRANISLLNSEYELNKNQNQFFITSEYFTDATIHFLKKYTITGEFNYKRLIDNTSGLDQIIPILNCSVARFIFKDNKGEVKASVINILNQNIAVYQFATLNYIQNSISNSLGSFYMLSLIYNFSRKQN